MHPILFEIPGIGFPVRAFGVLVVAGFLLGTTWFGRQTALYSVDPEAEGPGHAALPIWVLVGILIGARLMYVVVEVLRGSDVGQAYLDNPFKVLAYWEGGLVMYGGTIGGILAAVRCSQKYSMDLRNALDLGVTACFLGLSVGRVGCYLVGDDYGRIVPEGWASLPFPLTLHVPAVLPLESLFGDANEGQVLWATQIWMSAGALALFLVGAYVLLPRRRFKGQVALWLLLLYSIERAVIEAFRGDEVRGLWFGDRLSTSQLISIVLGLACLALLVKNRKLREDDLTPSASS